MLWVGIDTHLKMHRIEIQNKDGDAMWRGQINNDSDGFSRLLDKIRIIERSNSDSISAIFMNPTGNFHMPIRSFLEANGYRVIMVDARVSGHIRMTQNLGKEKSDSADASVLASTGRLKPSILESGNHERDPLSGLTRLMESVGREITRITNFMKADLAAVFPEYPFYANIDTQTSIEILLRFPTPEAVLNARLEDIADVMSRASRKHFGKDDAMNLMELAQKSVGITDRNGIYACRISMNAARLRYEKEKIQEIVKKIESMSGNNSDIDHISAIRGMSVVSAATIVSEIGDIGQFDSAVKLQSYGGKAPDLTGSGGKVTAVGVSRVRNSHLSNTAYESAVSLVKHRTPEFHDIFQREIKKGKKPTQAYIVVAKRLLYHVYSIMKNGKPYRERRPTGREGSVSGGTAS